LQARGTILLAEDSSDDVLIFKRVLKKACLTPRLMVVTDGQQAIDYLAGTGLYHDRLAYPLPVLILLDLKMPRKTGFDVLEWLSLTQNKIPAVVLSSSDEFEDVNQALRLGARACLTKPPSAEKLTELLQ